jgi:hypothetical protein
MRAFSERVRRMPPLVRRVGVFVLQSAIILAITVGLLESLIVFSFRNPSVSPIPMTLLRQMHVLLTATRFR